MTAFPHALRAGRDLRAAPWFELELADHAIARRVDVPYRRLRRFMLTLRRAIAAFEVRSIVLLKGKVAVDETYFGVHSEVADHYVGASWDPLPTTLDHLVAAAGG